MTEKQRWPVRRPDKWMTGYMEEVAGRPWQALCEGCRRGCKVYSETSGWARFECWDYEGKEEE